MLTSCPPAPPNAELNVARRGVDDLIQTPTPRERKQGAIAGGDDTRAANVRDSGTDPASECGHGCDREWVRRQVMRWVVRRCERLRELKWTSQHLGNEEAGGWAVWLGTQVYAVATLAECILRDETTAVC